MAMHIQVGTLWIILIGVLVQTQVILSNVILPLPEIRDRPLGPSTFEGCLSDGDYPHETKCELFYRCKDGKADLMGCRLELDMIFNTAVKFCDFAYDTHCGNRTRPDNVSETLEPPKTTIAMPTTTAPTTTISTTRATTVTVSTSTTSVPTTTQPGDKYNCTIDGAFPHPMYCKLYFDCWNGTSTLLECPANPAGQEQLFDTEYAGCTIATLTDCGDRLRPSPSFECPNKQDEYYSDPFNCKGFYRCVDGISTHYICPDELLFNPEIDVCDYPVSVNCADRRRTS